MGPARAIRLCSGHSLMPPQDSILVQSTAGTWYGRNSSFPETTSVAAVLGLHTIPGHPLVTGHPHMLRSRTACSLSTQGVSTSWAVLGLSAAKEQHCLLILPMVWKFKEFSWLLQKQKGKLRPWAAPLPSRVSSTQDFQRSQDLRYLGLISPKYKQISYSYGRVSLKSATHDKIKPKTHVKSHTWDQP